MCAFEDRDRQASQGQPKSLQFPGLRSGPKNYPCSEAIFFLLLKVWKFIFKIPEQNSLKSRDDPGVYWKLIDFEGVFGPAYAMN